jgi:hypothetical protein
VEGEMKEKNEAKERARKDLKEKDKVEIMAQKTQAVILEVIQGNFRSTNSSRGYYGGERSWKLEKSSKDYEQVLRTYSCAVCREHHWRNE